MVTTQTDRLTGAVTVAATTRVTSPGRTLRYFGQGYFAADYFAPLFLSGGAGYLLTDRVTGAATASTTTRVSGTPTGALTYPFSFLLGLSGDSDGSNLLLSGDMTDGDDVLEVSGRQSPAGTPTTRV